MFENVTAIGITVRGNKGSVILKEIHIFDIRFGGLALSYMTDIKFHSAIYGLPNLCDPFLNIMVKDHAYLYFPPRYNVHDPRHRQVCSNQVFSPENTTILFRILAPTKGMLGVIYDSPTMVSKRILNFYYWSTIGSRYKVQTSSNSMFLIVRRFTSHRFFLAEIKIEGGKIILGYILLGLFCQFLFWNTNLGLRSILSMKRMQQQMFFSIF